MDLNQQTIIGRVGGDVDTKTLDSGLVIVKASVATSSTTPKGEKNTEWHNVVLFGKQGELFSSMVKKGASVYIQGDRKTSSYEKDGLQKTYAEITVKQFIILQQPKNGTFNQPFVPNATATPF